MQFPTEPTIQPLADFQKRNCIASGCQNAATQQVEVAHAQNDISQIRCCIDPDCVKKATKLANRERIFDA